MAKSKKYWQKKADTEWSRVIRGIGHCQMCLSGTKQLHAHHIIGRTNLAYRHEILNGVCLCAGCHTLSQHSAHQDKTFFLKWLEKDCWDKWSWFMEHTVEDTYMVGDTEYIRHKPIKSEHIGDEIEYNMLKEIK